MSRQGWREIEAKEVGGVWLPVCPPEVERKITTEAEAVRSARLRSFSWVAYPAYIIVALAFRSVACAFVGMLVISAIAFVIERAGAFSVEAIARARAVESGWAWPR